MGLAHSKDNINIIHRTCDICHKALAGSKLEEMSKEWLQFILCDNCIKDLQELIKLKHNLK